MKQQKSLKKDQILFKLSGTGFSTFSIRVSIFQRKIFLFSHDLLENNKDKSFSKVALELKKKDLMNGLQFFMGTLDRFDSASFLQYIQSEISRFQSISRSDEEIRQFQSKLFQSLEVFNNLSRLMSGIADSNDDSGELAGQHSR